MTLELATAPMYAIPIKTFGWPMLPGSNREIYKELPPNSPTLACYLG